MKKQKTYSSPIVKLLLEHKCNRWNFWKNDWSERIIVEWDGKQPLSEFRNEIEKLVGRNFIYERALNNEATNYTVTNKGLNKFTK